MKYIYIILSKTPSKFGKTIRFILNNNYNHISISLDNLKTIYSFGRRKNTMPLDGGFVEENLLRFNLNKNIEIPCKIYKIFIDNNTYFHIKNKLNEIKNDNEYMYNLYSALSFPLSKGFKTYKSFTCVEFGAYILLEANIPLKKEPQKYTPEELGSELEPYLIYNGDLTKYETHIKKGDLSYFDKQPYIYKTKTYIYVLFNLTKRTFYNIKN